MILIEIPLVRVSHCDLCHSFAECFLLSVTKEEARKEYQKSSCDVTGLVEEDHIAAHSHADIAASGF